MQREELPSGWKEDGTFVGEGGGVSRWGARRDRLNSRSLRAGRLKGEEVIGLDGCAFPGEAETQQGVRLYEWELPRALNLEE